MLKGMLYKGLESCLDQVGKMCKQLVGARIAYAWESRLQKSKQLRLLHVTEYKVAVHLSDRSRNWIQCGSPCFWLYLITTEMSSLISHFVDRQSVCSQARGLRANLQGNWHEYVNHPAGMNMEITLVGSSMWLLYAATYIKKRKFSISTIS